MSLVINTNVSSLTAQRAIAGSKHEVETAMERLSTGSKINRASDDAAGLAMTQRMTAQIQGLNMAIKNSNDGIAMTKSIEGALTEVSDMLQRMRELSIQAANGTNSSADRTYLQDEVNLLIQEITRVSANTRYNGTLILDGTFVNKQMQVGIEEGEQITFSVDSVAADRIGAHTLIGNGLNPENAAGSVTAAVNPITQDEDIQIFGYLGTKTVTASVGDSVKDTATKINLLTSETGVKAYAKTYAAISSQDETPRTYNVSVNGFQTGNFIISKGNVGDAVKAINQISGSTGVTAEVENNKIVLFDPTGKDITVENSKDGTESVDLWVEKLGEDGQVSNVIGDPIRLGAAGSSTNTPAVYTMAHGATTTAEAVYTMAHGTPSEYDNVTTLSDGTTTLTITHTGDAPADAAELLADITNATGYSSFKYDITEENGNLVFTAKTAGAIESGAEPTLTTGSATPTGLTAIAETTPGSLGYDNVTTLSDGTTTLTITHTGDAPADAAELLADITNATGYSSFKYDITQENGNLIFTAKMPGTIQSGEVPTLTTGSATPTGITAIAETTPGVSADTTRITGSLKLVSPNAFSIEQLGNSTGNTGYFTNGPSASDLQDLTLVKIHTEAGAGDAISIIDAALDKVAQMRSNLGAIENRMDHTISNLMNIAERTADSRSRLEDADFALESARLAKSQVLQQAGTSMLSQANQMTQLVMDLIRG